MNPKGQIQTIIFPGMHGTEGLLTDFCLLSPERFLVVLKNLPLNILNGYGSIANGIAETLPAKDKLLLIAESFSGPIAVKMASGYPDKIWGVVLVASFIDPPVTSLIQRLPWKLLFSWPLPEIICRWLLLSNEASRRDVRKIQKSLSQIPPEVMANRLDLILGVDETESLKNVRCPLLYIQPTKDKLVPDRCWQTIKRIKPDAKCVSIDGPHFILQRNPKEAWRHIEEFVKSIDLG